MASSVHGHHVIRRHSTPALVPVETDLGSIGGLRFVGIGEVPPIRRKSGGLADRSRRVFLEFAVPLLPSRVRLDGFAQAMGSAWSGSLSADYPKRYAAAGQLPPLLATFGGTKAVTGSTEELVSAAAILMRAGLLVIDGGLKLGVTRAGQHVSPDGKRFILGEEGDGTHLYWPGNPASGVTVGPGYDMGNRPALSVRQDLTNAGVDQATASAAALGAGTVGKPAGDFAKRHQNIAMTREQQNALFDRVAPQAESLVFSSLTSALNGRLFQHELDALTSLAFNIRNFAHHDCIRAINRLDMTTVTPSWLTLVWGGPGIPDRRRRETLMFDDAVYICKALPQAGVRR